MPRVYAVSFTAVAVSAAQDLFEITPGSNKPVEIVGIELGQYSDAGDAQDELLSLQIIRGYTSSGTGGSAFTPIALDPNDAAAGFSSEINNTTVANTGTAVVLHATSFNVRAGYLNYFPLDCRPKATAANTTMVVRITAPADAVTMNGVLYVREV